MSKENKLTIPASDNPKEWAAYIQSLNYVDEKLLEILLSVFKHEVKYVDEDAKRLEELEKELEKLKGLEYEHNR